MVLFDQENGLTGSKKNSKNVSRTCQPSRKAPDYGAMCDLLKVFVSLMLALWLPLQAIAVSLPDDCSHQMTDSVQAPAGLDHQEGACCKSAAPGQFPGCERCAACCLAADGGIVRPAGMNSQSYLAISIPFPETDDPRSHYADLLDKPPRIH
jgi:hypothetical protein